MLIAITAAGLFLRVWAIGQKGLWLDEAFSVWLAVQPWREMLGWIAAIDQHPPLYAGLLHGWIPLAGDTPGSVRLPSALLGAATIPVIFCLGRRLMGARIGLLAALILALSPFHVRFAQEARMYALLMFNAAAALLALAYLLPCTPARSARWHLALRWPWIGYVVFTAATMLTHNTAILFPLAINLFVSGYVLWWKAGAGGWGSGVRGQEPGGTQHATRNTQYAFLRAWLLAQLGVFLLWSPWLVAFVRQAAGVDREFWIPSPTFGAVQAAFKTFLSAMLPQLGGAADAIWATFGLLAILGIISLRRRPALLALLGILLLTPIAGELLVSLRRPIFDERTLIWATIPLYLLLAAGIAWLRRRTFIAGALAFVMIANGVSLQEYFLRFNKEGWDQAAAYVAARAEGDDLLIFNATWVQIPFDYYFRRYNLPVAEHGAPVDLFDRGILEPKMAESDLPRLRELIAGKGRVWLIYSHAWYTDPESLILAALAQEFRPRDRQEFIGLEVRLYERSPNIPSR